jgi:hypothetical protein
MSDISYTYSNKALSANWDPASDPESGIERYWYAIGTVQGGTAVTGGWLDNGTNTIVTRTGLSLAIGATYYFSVKAENGVGMIGLAANSNGQYVRADDTTPPSAPAAVRDGVGSDISSTRSTTQLSANWDDATDPESGIFLYYYAIGTSLWGTNTVGWTDNGNNKSVTRTGLTLAVGVTYYFSVKAENVQGLQGSAGNSDGQFVKALGPNLALSKPTVVSSTESPTYVGGRAVDGNATTGWASAWSDPQWIYVNLGQLYSLNYVILKWETAYGKAYQIQVSLDGNSWTDVYSTTSEDGGTDNISFSPAFGRYIRMYGTQRGTIWGYHLYEFEVYGDAVAPDTTPPSNITTVNDGTGMDIDSTYSTTQLSANWTASSDTESGISGYRYAIGTSAGNTDVAGWTSNTGTSITKTNLSLTVGVTYYFSVKAVNWAGLESLSSKSSDGQCVIGGGTGGDDTPPAISNVNAVNIKMTGATITWETDEPATSRVKYGPSAASYGNNTAEDGSLVTGHSVDLTDLMPGREYHYRVISRDSSGNEEISVDYKFTTVGENEIAAKVYPSPYSPSKGSSMRFSIDSTAGGEVKIYTVSGKLVKRLLIGAGESGADWDVLNEEGNSITAGLYIYSITDGAGNKKTGKIAITK